MGGYIIPWASQKVVIYKTQYFVRIICILSYYDHLGVWDCFWHGRENISSGVPRKTVQLNERSLTEKSTYWMIPFTQNSRKCPLTYSDRKQSVFTGDKGRGRERLQRDTRKLLEVREMLGVMISHIYIPWWFRWWRVCLQWERSLGSIPELGRSPGGGNGYSLQDSCLENPMDRGAWRATVYGVTKSDMAEWLTLSFYLNMDRYTYLQGDQY